MSCILRILISAASIGVKELCPTLSYFLEGTPVMSVPEFQKLR